MLFDSHTHLESPRFDDDREQVIARAHEAGVVRMITCGSDVATSAECGTIAQQHKGVYAAVGIHPHEARSAVESDARRPSDSVDAGILKRIEQLAQSDQVVAVGEIGLDYHYDFSPRPVQRAVFAHQLTLAKELDLPVILHNRESNDDFRRIVDAGPPALRGVMHSFLADDSMAQWALERGLYLGISGPITFKNVTHLDEIVCKMPGDRLLIETDCPYLAPHPFRGKRNEPAHVQHVAEHIARLLGTDLETVAHRTTDNANRLFSLS